mgnify:CR=1 FL=1
MAESQRYDIGHDTHYKKLVSTLGEKQNITTTGDIYSDQGHKLIAKGTKINERVSAQLLKHKLQSPLDSSLTIDEPVTVKNIVDDVIELVASSKTLTTLFNNLTESESIAHVMGSHKFPTTLALKLSVAKSERNDLYQHSLLIVCLSYFIGCKAQVSEQALFSVLLASLFHDIGLLHIDAAYFKSGRKLTSEERKFLHVHVVISHLIVKPYPEYQGAISLTVLDHHERLDGSGYPNGKSGKEICVSGQILAIAEVVASKFNHQNECLKTNELELLLNMNSRKLNPELYTHFTILFSDGDIDGNEDTSLSETEIHAKLHQLADILKSWLSLSTKQSSTTRFIGGNIDTLYESLTQAGLNFESLDFLIMMIEQDEIMKQHTDIIIKESSWQLTNLIEELKRRNLYKVCANDEPLSLWLNSIEEFAY